ncbi:hypothetical protein [Pseudoalteromonas sp. TB64]|uniref:hypothetical protein n=1 Tax=Pseudoalteromonas sp. TB64 TaxID=1938600 RepID=UPI001111500F|nr:hypothetical protein [Pseudoalteromonas sp. TB64]
MNKLKKIGSIFLILTATYSASSYAVMPCNYTSGKMTVTHSGNTVSYSCSGGGQVRCLIDPR